jgi:predicted NACHT family NTPase
MSERIYPWRRFWCPRASQINLGDRGYLCDPESEYGHLLNPELVGLDAIAAVPCLILLGEPGIGKSQEMKNLFKHTVESIKPSHPPLEINLRSCNSLAIDLIQNPDFIDWNNGEHRLYLFLDSLDEGMLTVANLATQIADEFSKAMYRNKLDRLYLRIACRTAVFPRILEEKVEELWKENNTAIYELAPLRRIDVENAAKEENIESQEFLSEVWGKALVPLAIKPLTLRFLLNIYKSNGNQFPSDQTLCSLYLKGCKLLCEENNLSRQGSNQRGTLEADQRLIIAARIAAITVFANRFAIWTGSSQGEMPVEDVKSEQLILGNEFSNDKSIDVTASAIREVLDTGLFSSRGLSRMGWAHQSYSEFLAAWYLKQHEVPLVQIKKLIFSSGNSDRRLIPQLHETAAWLASMREDVFQEIIKTDPDVLLQSDIPNDFNVIKLIVNNLLQQYETGELFGWDRNNYRNYAKLNHPELAEQLRPYIYSSSKQVDARDLAIDIAEVCKLSEIQEDLLNLAFDASQPIRLRAAKAIVSIGDTSTKFKLEPLAIAQLPEDENDSLKGYSLQATWPDYLTAEELFQSLTPPKKRNLYGKYRMFLEYQMVPKLHLNDLVVALDWLIIQGVRCLGHPFEEVGDAILLKAWQNFELPGVIEKFTEVALLQWRKYQSIIISQHHEIQQQFNSLFLHDTEKRYALIEQVVSIISVTEEDPYFLFADLTKEILVIDFDWMIEMLRISDCEKAQRIWTHLIKRGFLGSQNVYQISTLIVATQTNDILYREFGDYFKVIDLDSDLAAFQRSEYLEMKEMNNLYQMPLLELSTKDRIVQCLEQLESGNIAIWWDLNRQMTLKLDSQHYGDEFELDLTQLPGWQEAEETIQQRIIQGAKSYIQQQDKISYEWIGTDTCNLSAIAGCKAFYLLMQEDLTFLEQLPPEIWKKWSPIIIASPNNDQKDSYLELVKCAYFNSPDNSLHTLLELIDKENLKNDDLFVIHLFNQCWDERLKLSLLEKLQDSTLKPEFIEQLLEWLLERGASEAKDFAKSLIISPIPLTDNDRKKTLVGAKILVEKSDPSSWSLLWSIIQEDSSFGCQVIELVAIRYPNGIILNISEQQLAELYVWLVSQYPYDEDSDYSNQVMAHSVTNRDCVAELRNSILFQLKERGTIQSCNEIQRLIQILPGITCLGRTLIEAQTNMRRRTWQALSPEEILQLVVIQQPSNSELHNQLKNIERKTQQMADEPKIDNSVRINNSKINGDVNTGNIENRGNPNTGFDWKGWLAIIIPVMGLFMSGVFNDEIKKFFSNPKPSPQIHKNLDK